MAADERCRHCSRAIRFAMDHKGRRVPLDARMVPGGQYALQDGETQWSLPLLVRLDRQPAVGWTRHKCR